MNPTHTPSPTSQKQLRGNNTTSPADTQDATVQTVEVNRTSSASSRHATDNDDDSNLLYRFLWLITNVFFLGFARKFLQRVKLYAKASDNEQASTVQKAADAKEIEKWREGQQEEWDRLATTLSLLATIAAASLAFSGIDQAWWLGRSMFAGALGLSLCGFFTIHYFGVLALGSSDEDMSKAVSGQLTGMKTQKVVAAAMAVPVVISAYSTLLILLGHCIFVGTIRSTNNSSNGNGTTTLPSKYSSSISEPGFMIVAGIPIIIGIVMAGGAVIVAEAMYNRSADESTKRLEEGLVQRSR